MKCLVCDCAEIECLYTSARSVSITSLGAAIDAPTKVYFCTRCGHLQTQELLDVQQYYDDRYNINSASDDEDQLYGLVEGKPVFRSAHQTATFLSRTDLPHGARVLDYGCGSGHIARAIAAKRSDLDIHLFDVSQNYKPSWSRWLAESNMACYSIPDTWRGTFDLIVSFFALEHACSPQDFVCDLFRALKPGGQAYLVVPNTYQNVADLIVVDHVNHFSKASLRWLLESAGFTIDYLSDTDHDSAWTVVAKRPENASPQANRPTPEARAAIADQARGMATFWTDSDARIAAFEAEVPALPATIYGSGFYGSYLYTRLSEPSRIQGFVDRNPHQQKKKLFGRSITDPQSLTDQPQAIWVGLNPRVAKSAIGDLKAWQGRPYRYFYL